MPGVARRQCSESTACESASIPAAAVSAGGQDRVRSGSTSATLGQLRMSNRFIFFLRAVSVMTADGLTSLPVPAVVGRASTGSGSSRRAPKSSQSRGCPPLVSSRRDALGRVDRRPAAHGDEAVGLDVGGQAPPRPGSRRPAGSARTCWKTTTSSPAAMRLSRTGPASPAACTPGSVTSSTLCIPSAGRARPGLPGHAAAEEHARGHVELAVGGHALAAPGGRRVRRCCCDVIVVPPLDR